VRSISSVTVAAARRLALSLGFNVTLLLQVIFHEIVQPIIYGTGWLLVFLASAGTVRPTRARFHKYPLVGLLGLLFLLALPTLVAMAWRETSLLPSTMKLALTNARTRQIVVDSSEIHSRATDRYSPVARWMVEVDESGVPTREVGLNRDGHPLYRAPSSAERGVFTDSNVTFGTDWGSPVSLDQFETLWARAPVAIR
jgi:hypothetical protein